MRSLVFLILLFSLLFLVTATTQHHETKKMTSAEKSSAWTIQHHTKNNKYISSYSPFMNMNDNNNDNNNDHDDDEEERQEEMMEDLLLGDESALCRQYDCPTFNATAYPTYTLRTYTNNTFACTTIRSFKGIGESKKAFMRLYDYFDGESSTGIKINMTVPVIRYVKPGNGSHPNVTICFFLPSSLQGSIPTPNNQDIHVFTMDSFTVAIRPFFGWSTHQNVGSNLLRHQFALHLAGQEFVKERYVHAAYTEPWILFPRYNEIWTFIKQEGDDQDFWQKPVKVHTPASTSPAPASAPTPQRHHRFFHTRPQTQTQIQATM